MEQFAIFKNQQQIGFPFNSFNHALTMLNSIKEFITDESDYQINDIDDHTFVVTTNSTTNNHSFNNFSLLNDNNHNENEEKDDDNNNSFTLTIKSFKL